VKISRLILAVVFSIVLSFELVSLSSWAADTPCKNPCGKPASWSEFNVYTLKVTSPDTPGYHSIWHGQFDKDSADIQIDAETAQDGATKTGKILMIGGRVLALHGNIATPGYEIDAIDGAVLQYEAVLSLLGAALPEGAANLKDVRKIDFSNETGIQVATKSAEWLIPPPLHVKGNVRVEAPGVVEYELALTAGLKGKPETEGGWQRLNYTGRLSKITTARLDDSMALDGWTLYWVGPYAKKAGGGTIYDFGAQPASDLQKTVGGIRVDIRKKSELANYPGQLDASKDFTGFWETKCDEGFGLQIMHYGSDGKYSIVFCGPGGCLDRSKTTTFITGDKKHYEVVSESELEQINLDGSKTTYHRCTKDAHPVLKTQK
jgi:hypothetical protein